MARSAWVAASWLVALGCGGSAPNEETIFYDPSLRAGVVAPVNDEERAVLARLGDLSPGAEVQLGDVHFVAEAPYPAASGRLCRALRASSATRLACAGDHGWVFVPEVLEPAERVE